MTKKSKELIREKKVLQDELLLAKSQGPAREDQHEQMRQ